MANLTVTATAVAPVEIYEAIEGLLAGEAITAGQYVRVDATTGKLVVGRATTAGNIGNRGGIALKSVAANEPVTAVKRGLINLGLSTLDALNYDAVVYLSDTLGTLADSAGTVSKIIGAVYPIRTETTPAKVLWVDL